MLQTCRGAVAVDIESKTLSVESATPSFFTFERGAIAIGVALVFGEAVATQTTCVFRARCAIGDGVDKVDDLFGLFTSHGHAQEEATDKDGADAGRLAPRW